MITLITGVPGAGKTLYCVDQIMRPEADKGRALYVDGIPDLLLPHEPAPDPMDWPAWAPEGAHIVIDEVQRLWRPEAAGKTPPESIAQLETHRHRGLDFTILTQHPNLIHSNVRRLVGRHIHIRRTPLGVYAYEWSECKTAPDNAWKSAISKTRFSHPKRSFNLYKSASVHQKVTFRTPKALFLIGACALAIPVLLYYSVSILSNPIANIGGESAQADTTKSKLDLTQTGQPSKSAPAPKPEITGSTIRESFIPRVYGEPWTAPAYDSMRVVRNMPTVSACIASADDCACYTEQMTRIDMPVDMCRQRVERRAYDPYGDAAQPRTVGGESPAPTTQKET